MTIIIDRWWQNKFKVKEIKIYKESALENNLDVLNYQELIKKYSWILERDHNCILSPDSDGLLCGLFMSNYLNWKIVGFYDGKILIKDKKIDLNECIFLYM